MTPAKVRQATLAEVAQLRAEIKMLEQQKEELLKVRKEVEDYINDSKTVNDRYAEDLEKLKKVELNQLKYYMSLYNRYKYALEYSDSNPNADFGFSDLVYLDILCDNYKVPTALMLAIFKVESSFNSQATNSTSTATGYGQLLNTTAKATYEKILSRGKYDISRHRILAKDKKLNMDMSVAYISRNIQKYRSARQACELYYGHPDQSERNRYISMINTELKRYNYTIDTVVK
jgi:hypothetical protein